MKQLPTVSCKTVKDALYVMSRGGMFDLKISSGSSRCLKNNYDQELVSSFVTPLASIVRFKDQRGSDHIYYIYNEYVDVSWSSSLRATEISPDSAEYLIDVSDMVRKERSTSEYIGSISIEAFQGYAGGPWRDRSFYHSWQQRFDVRVKDNGATILTIHPGGCIDQTYRLKSGSEWKIEDIATGHTREELVAAMVARQL